MNKYLFFTNFNELYSKVHCLIEQATCSCFNKIGSLGYLPHIYCGVFSCSFYNKNGVLKNNNAT
ncbi:hypothetical protein NTHI1209_01803 [Haemophilus influenzae]|uniref:Uncharacterized protein n=1 Tax=Haemophilus influenzae TaxID=727 RepID=A0A158SZ69_HAEIF|nr:hypothetical protein NTHI1209_01803 [Haemophilus influenzae]